jgi:hypothetical protein
MGDCLKMPGYTKKRRNPPRSTNSQPAEAKVFMTGRSQAVRLPLEYRVSGAAASSSSVWETKTGDRLAAAFAALDEFPRDFKLHRKPRQVKRPGLANLFGRHAE